MTYKNCGCLLLVFLLAIPVLSQSPSSSPYRLNWRSDAPALGTGLGLSITGCTLETQVEPRTEMELKNLTFNKLLGLDEKAIDNYSHSADQASDWLARGSILLPLALMSDADIRHDAGKISVLFSETVFIAYGLTTMTKTLVLRDRPFVYNSDVPIEEKLKPAARLSFFSGHTSMTACLSFFSAKVWSDYHPDSKLKPVVWTAAAALPAVTGYLRYKAGKHYFSDVAAGYAVGALVAYFVPHFHKIDRRSKRKFRVSSVLFGNTPVFVVKYRF